MPQVLIYCSRKKIPCKTTLKFVYQSDGLYMHLTQVYRYLEIIFIFKIKPTKRILIFKQTTNSYKPISCWIKFKKLNKHLKLNTKKKIYMYYLIHEQRYNIFHLSANHNDIQYDKHDSYVIYHSCYFLPLHIYPTSLSPKKKDMHITDMKTDIEKKVRKNSINTIMTNSYNLDSF